MVWPTLGSRIAKEQKRTALDAVAAEYRTAANNSNCCNNNNNNMISVTKYYNKTKTTGTKRQF